MKFHVVITNMASAEMEWAHAWIADRAPLAADRWKQRLLTAVRSLETSPAGYPLAPEAANFGREIRQMLFGKRRGAYRILFEIQDDTVVVLRIRHGAMKFFDEK